MSDPKRSVDSSKVIIRSLKVVPKLPIYINRNNKITLLEGQSAKDLLINSKKKPLYREDILYQSSQCDFLGESPTKVVLFNRLHLLTNCSQTFVREYNSSDTLINERSSESVTKLIGQKNYDTIFSALCSVFNQEVKIKGILALLTAGKTTETATQTDPENEKSFEEKCCQTDVNCMDLIFKSKQKKRIKRSQLTPYVVKDQPVDKKKVIITPEKFKSMEAKIFNPKTPEQHELLDLKGIMDEDSNGSIGNISTLSGLSLGMKDLLDPKLIFQNIDQNTEANFKPGETSKLTLLDKSTATTQSDCDITQPEVGTTEHRIDPAVITLLDKTQIMVAVKPEDQFHLATPEILQNATREERIKLKQHQMIIDWRCCLDRDEEDNLPIHLAVMNNDLDLLRRQCIVLRNRRESLDILAGNLSAMQMSIFQENAVCTAMLLHYGADPLLTDDEHRSAAHLAAEGAPGHLNAIIAHIGKKARQILMDHEDLWKAEMANQSDEELSAYLLEHVCKMVDNQGYTALMLAAKMGNYANVKLLAEASPSSVDIPTPNSGNTALYLAVGAASIDAANRGNKSKIAEHYHRTISILIDKGADPTIKNHSNSDVSDLLTEFNNAELSMLVTYKLHSNKFGETNNIESFIIIKNEDETNTIKKDTVVNKANKILKLGPSKKTISTFNTKAKDISTNITNVVTDPKIKTESKEKSLTKNEVVILQNIKLESPLKIENFQKDLRLVQANDKNVVTNEMDKDIRIMDCSRSLLRNKTENESKNGDKEEDVTKPLKRKTYSRLGPNAKKTK